MDGNVTWRLTGAVLAVAVLTSCMAGSPQFFEPTPEILQNREMKTRKYEGISEVDILSASAAVLQDLGFSIDESETKLGIIVGSKRSDASSDVEEALQVLTAILSLGTGGMVIDEVQEFRASIVIRPASTENVENHNVSVTFQRTVWDSDDRVSKRETLEAPEIYQDFFDRLSQSVFLERQEP